MTDIYYKVAHRSQAEIDSFKTRYDDFDTSLIPQIFKASLDLTVTDFTPSDSWGSSHVIYFVNTREKSEPLVLRTNLGFNSQPEVVMLAEKLITQKVSKLGIPTNKIIHVDVSRKQFPFDFQIQEMLVGEDPEISFKGTEDEYNQLSFDLGVKVAKYHQLTFPLFGRFDRKLVLKNKLQGTKQSFFDYITTCLNDDLSYLTKSKIISLPKSNQIKKLFKEHKKIININKGVLVHHDLADHNIRFQGSKVTGIFDWEAAVIGDPVLDLASCPTWKTIYPREKKLIQGYKSITNLPDHFQEKMNIYRLRTMLWKAVYVTRMNIMNDLRKQTFLNSLKPFNL